MCPYNPAVLSVSRGRGGENRGGGGKDYKAYNFNVKSSYLCSFWEIRLYVLYVQTNKQTNEKRKKLSIFNRWVCAKRGFPVAGCVSVYSN